MTDEMKTNDEPLKVPTEADAKARRDAEADALIPKEEPFRIGEKTIWICELSMKDRLKLDKVYLRILTRGFDVYKQYANPTEANTERLVKTITEDLERMNSDDLEFLMIALGSVNKELTKEDLMDLRPSELRVLFDKILSINGISEVLKKMIPPDLKTVLQ